MYKDPSFLIIGTMKSGTTSLYGALTQHPKITPAQKKEVRYLINGKHKDHYLKLFNECEEDTITGEATPAYICFEKVAKKVKNWFPNILLIVLFRNPITRAYSHFLSEFNQYKKDNESIEECFIRFTSNIDESNPIFWRGHYAKQLFKWLKYFDLEQFEIIKAEWMFNEFGIIVNRMFHRLGLKSIEVRESKLNSTQKNLPKRIGRYPELTDEAKTNLKEYYEPFNKDLYNLIKRNFQWEK